MPIFKWKGNHYTGPARPKAMEEGTVLSDSLMSIATWAANNPGKGVDAMLKELAPVPEQEKASEEEVAQAMENSRIWSVICSGCPNRAISWFSPITLSAAQEPSPPKLLLPRRLPRKNGNRKRRARTRRQRTPLHQKNRRQPLLPRRPPPERKHLKKTAWLRKLRNPPPFRRKSSLEIIFRRRFPQKPDAFPYPPSRHTVRRIILILRTLFCRSGENQQDFTI